MITKTYPVGTLPAYKYVVVLSEYQGKILLSRHKKRTTWETQGGKIEPRERHRLWRQSVNFTRSPGQWILR